MTTVIWVTLSNLRTRAWISLHRESHFEKIEDEGNLTNIENHKRLLWSTDYFSIPWFALLSWKGVFVCLFCFCFLFVRIYADTINLIINSSLILLSLLLFWFHIYWNTKVFIPEESMTCAWELLDIPCGSEFFYVGGLISL